MGTDSEGEADCVGMVQERRQRLSPVQGVTVSCQGVTMSVMEDLGPTHHHDRSTRLNTLNQPSYHSTVAGNPGRDDTIRRGNDLQKHVISVCHCLRKGPIGAWKEADQLFSENRNF